MDNATPRPWKLDELNIIRDVEEHGIDLIARVDDGCDENYRSNAANSRLIVRAVNSHDHLIYALIEAKRAIMEHMACVGDSDILMAPMNVINQALNQAEAV